MGAEVAQRSSGGRHLRRIRALEFGNRRAQIEEAAEAVIGILHRAVILIAQAEVESQPLGDLEVVLYKQREEIIARALDGDTRCIGTGSMAPSRKLAQPSPLSAVFGLLNVLAVELGLKSNRIYCGRAAFVLSRRYSPPAFT